MNQQYLFDPIPCDKFDLLSKDELIGLNKDLQDLNRQYLKHIKTLEEKLIKDEQKSFVLGEQLFNIKNKLFGRSSEKSGSGSEKESKKSSKKRVRLPSEKYKNLDVIEKDVTFDEDPSCPSCSEKMQESGLFETNEYLTFIPRRYYIVREKKHKYRCKSCQSALLTTPSIPRLVPGGSFSDEMIIDVAVSKYQNLIPVERYTQIAKRDAGIDLAANSLITSTHKLSEAITASYELIKEEVFGGEVIHADETKHRMLEGDKKSSWYLWGFSTKRSSYFEIQDTRSGSVASDLLKGSSCKYLVSDVFSGYQKAVTEVNRCREDKIQSLYCNAHARRKFIESRKNFEKESEFFIRLYQKIYKLNDKDYETILDEKRKREWQRLYMLTMERYALKLKTSYSRTLSIGKAARYFSNNFEELVRFTTKQGLPIDNNHQERQLRSPVVGRKTWYGTHSKRGARTTQVLFSIVESCKLNQINSREYLIDLVRALHQGRPAFSPKTYAQSRKLAVEKT